MSFPPIPPPPGPAPPQQNLTDPTTWENLMDKKIATQYSESAFAAFDCINQTYFSHAQNITTDEMINQTVDYINYVFVMKNFYNAMGVLRILFSIFLIGYQIKRYYLKDSLTPFQSMIIWMIQCFTLLQSIYSFFWSYRVFTNCEMATSSLSALIDINMFCVGMLVTYFLFTTISKIHWFAKKGRLPKETTVKNQRNCMIVLTVITIIVILLYVIFNVYFYKNGMYNLREDVNYVFVCVRAFGLSINATLLSLTIWKLKSAKVKRAETGHMKIKNAIILLILQLLMITTGLSSEFLPDDWFYIKLIDDILKDIIDFFLGIMYFIMITNFITTFKMQTKVNLDGSIDIVGIDPNGREVFKFNLDESSHQKLLGFAKDHPSQLIANSLYKKEEEKEKNKFEVIQDNDSENDFTDSDTSSVQQNVFDGYSDFVPEYEVCHIKEIKKMKYQQANQSPKEVRYAKLTRSSQVEAPLSSRGTKQPGLYSINLDAEQDTDH